MAEGDLTARIAVDRTETELGQVALALNQAFDRQRDSIERQRQFTADASHQLRTPVATMMAELDWALMRERSGEDYRETLDTCKRAGTRMQSLVQGLLTLARAESGELRLQRVEARLDRIVEDAVEMLRPLADAAWRTASRRAVSADRRRRSGSPSRSRRQPDLQRHRLQPPAGNSVDRRAARTRARRPADPRFRDRDRDRSTCRRSSTASIGPTRRERGNQPAPGWVSRSRSGSSPPTRARSSARANRGVLPRSSCRCPSPIRQRLPPATDDEARGWRRRQSCRAASTASVNASVQIDVRPSAASSE